MQSALPCALFGKEQSEIVLRGGTNAEMAPQIDYIMLVIIIYWQYETME